MPFLKAMQSHLWRVLTRTEQEQVGCSSASYSLTYEQEEKGVGSEKLMKPDVSVSVSDR